MIPHAHNFSSFFRKNLVVFFFLETEFNKFVVLFM